METRINIMINAEVVASRGPIDAPVFVSGAVSAWCASADDVRQEDLERATLEHFGKTEQLDPAQMDVIYFAWTELEYEILPPPPPQ